MVGPVVETESFAMDRNSHVLSHAVQRKIDRYGFENHQLIAQTISMVS
jgi:hypothetical protein